jgi:hypothetical protein
MPNSLATSVVEVSDMIATVTYSPSGMLEEDQFIAEVTALMSDFGYVNPGLQSVGHAIELSYEKEQDDSST